MRVNAYPDPATCRPSASRSCWIEPMLWRIATTMLILLMFSRRGSLENRKIRPAMLWRIAQSAPRFPGESAGIGQPSASPHPAHPPRLHAHGDDLSITVPDFMPDGPTNPASAAEFRARKVADAGHFVPRQGRNSALRPSIRRLASSPRRWTAMFPIASEPFSRPCHRGRTGRHAARSFPCARHETG